MKLNVNHKQDKGTVNFSLTVGDYFASFDEVGEIDNVYVVTETGTGMYLLVGILDGINWSTSYDKLLGLARETEEDIQHDLLVPLDREKLNLIIEEGALISK